MRPAQVSSRDIKSAASRANGVTSGTDKDRQDRLQLRDTVASLARHPAGDPIRVPEGQLGGVGDCRTADHWSLGSISVQEQ